MKYVSVLFYNERVWGDVDVGSVFRVIVKNAGWGVTVCISMMSDSDRHSAEEVIDGIVCVRSPFVIFAVDGVYSERRSDWERQAIHFGQK